MNKWLSIVAATAEKYFGFLRDDFGFEIDIAKQGSTETAVAFSKPGAKIVILLFMMPIEGSPPWIVFRDLASSNESIVSLDDLMKLRCPDLCLTTKEKRSESTVCSRYSAVLKKHFTDLLGETISLHEVAVYHRKEKPDGAAIRGRTRRST